MKTLPENYSRPGSSASSLPDAGASRCICDEDAALRYFEQCLWNGKPVCPKCSSVNATARKDGKSWRCNACRGDFTIRTGTVMAHSHFPLRTWLHAICLVAEAPGTMSSVRLGKELGIRQASAWRILQRLRAAPPEFLRAIVGEHYTACAGNDGGFAGQTQKKETGMALSRQELARRIHDGIRDGSLVVNGRLPPEREIAALFQTGRGTVREAVIVLETLGFVEVRGKEGVFVRTVAEDECNGSLDVYTGWPSDMLPHAFQVRLLLESEAAGLAARNRTEEDVGRLQACVKGLHDVFRSRPADWSVQAGALNELFHKLIFEAAHNPVMIRMHEGLLRATQRAYSTFGSERPVLPVDDVGDKVVKSHRNIVEAIEKNNERSAKKYMHAHLKIAFMNLDSVWRKRIDGVLHRTQE